MRKFANPYKAAALGYLDDVIEPNETRRRLARALEMLYGQGESCALPESTGTSHCEALE